MKKEHIHEDGERQKPRIPEDGRQRIKTGGPHRNKKAYKRNKKHQKQEE